MTSPYIDYLYSTIKNARLFSWRVSDILKLVRFSVRRVGEENLAQVAGSLTFTTVLALVPMLTIALTIFTAFPLFTTFRESLEAYFIQNLLPHAISSSVLDYLNQFALKATRLSAYGAILLMVTSIVTLATIDQVLNAIWRVKQKRPLLKRMLVYWALITLAPLLIGVSLSVTSYVFSATTQVVTLIPGSKLFFTVVSLAFTTSAFSLLYMVVPNQRVDWRDAAWGGLVAGVLFEIAKRIFAGFIINIPSYTFIYGAVAVIPIFLIWMYTSWLITLSGAVIAASLPVVKYERWWHEPTPGSDFIDAMALLEVLFNARINNAQAGVSSNEIREKTQLGFDEIENLLTQMIKAGWVGHLDEEEMQGKKSPALPGSAWWILLAHPGHILLSQVYRLFSFEPQADTRLSKKVEEVIEHGLEESLENYFLKR